MGGNVELEKRGEMRGIRKKWGKIWRGGEYKRSNFEKGPAGSGRVEFINHATVPRRRSVSVVTTRRWFRRVCPTLKITERRTWYDGGIRRVVVVSVSDCCRVIFCRIS